MEHPGILALSRDGRTTAAAAIWPYPVRLVCLDWLQPETVVEIEGPEAPPMVELSDDGELLALAGEGGFGLRIFSPADGGEVRRFDFGHTEWAIFTAGSGAILLGTRAAILRLDRATWSVTHRVPLEGLSFCTAARGFDGGFVAMKCVGNTLGLLDPADGTTIATIAVPGSGAGRFVVTPDGRRIVVGDTGGIVRILDLDRVGRTLESLGYDWPLGAR